MAFPLKLAATLSGTTPSQLRRLRERGLVVPEVRPYRPPIYSFRDVVLLRTLAFLRQEVSLQRIGKAFRSLDMLELTDHPSAYRFGTDGKTILVEHDGQALDLVEHPGQIELFTFEDITRQFRNFRGDLVAEFRHPAPNIEVLPRRLGGWPTIERTRVPYDVIANLVDFDTILPEDVPSLYPSVTADAARSAVSFAAKVEALAA